MNSNSLLEISIVLTSGETLRTFCTAAEYKKHLQRHKKFVEGLSARTDSYRLLDIGHIRVLSDQIAALYAHTTADGITVSMDVLDGKN